MASDLILPLQVTVQVTAIVQGMPKEQAEQFAAASVSLALPFASMVTSVGTHAQPLVPKLVTGLQ